MDHSHSSSSSSSMDDASMDDSDREHSYDYDIDDGDEDDDEEPHDDFEDVHDPDDEEDDGMDDDDEDDEEEDVVLVEPMVAPIDPSNTLSASLSNALNELRSIRTRVDLPFFSRAIAAVPPTNGHHALDHFLADSPLVTIPSRSALNAAAAVFNREHTLRSVVLDTFESRRRIPIHEPYRGGADPLAALTACLRGGLSALQPSRYWSNESDNITTPSAVHPMLCRPAAGPMSESSDPTVSIMSSLRRSLVTSRASESFTIPTNSNAEEIDPRVRIAQSFQDIRGALSAADANEEDSSVQSRMHTTEAQDAASRPIEEAVPSMLGGPSEAGLSAVDVAAAASLACLRGGVGAGPSSTVVAPVETANTGNPERQTGEISAWLDAALGEDAERSRPDRMRELAEQDLMRSMEPIGMRNTMENVLGMISRSRNPYDRLVNRDREREKIPSGILKRWVYDPPSCGGDSLPAIFDTDMAQRNSRSNGRSAVSNPGQPLIAPETHEAVNQLAVKVIHRLDGLFSDLSQIDEKIAAQELTEKERKEAAIKKKEEEDAKAGTETTKEIEGSAAGAGESGSSAAGVISVPTEQAASTPREIESEAGPEGIEARSQQAPESHVVREEEPERPDAILEMLSAVGGDPDAIMSTAEEEIEQNEGSREEAAPTNGNDVAGRETDGDPGEGASDDASAPAPNDFAAVAAQRAAAAGISLDAPANENPEVVAAATQSTGIDPAFLAALPEDMRSEILTQYYERTNAAGGGGSSSSPSATTVNQDFLIALPPYLRAEVLELEAEFQSRHNNSSGGNGGGNAGGPAVDQDGGRSGAAMAGAEMDNATFLATLAPDLREEILLTSGEAFIESLPPNVAAEARVLRDRDVVSRFPWRMSGEFPIGFDSRRFPNGLRGPGQAQGRQPTRQQPREPPRYRWKKVENGWLREVPKTADEPRPALKSDGLSSLINLLWLKQGHYGKTLIYQVLSNACKSTESRLLVLEELIKLITGDSPVQDTFASTKTQKRREVERSRQHGTAVRRALELLTLLCKNDVVVAETLLGLPQTNEDLAAVPQNISEDTIMPHREAEVSLSTLVSLLDTPLFVRSTSHLEQLLGLINALCVELPSTLCDESDRRSGSRSLMRRRRFGSRSSGLDYDRRGDSMNFLLVDADVDAAGDPHAVFHVTDDGEEDEDSDEDPYAAAVIPRVERGAERRRGTSGDTAKTDAAKDIAIPPQYRIPGFRRKDLVSLTRVLLRQGCSDRMYEKVSRSIGVLGELVPIRITFVESLVTIAVNSGQNIHKQYEKIITSIEESRSASSSQKKSDVISSFSVANASSELTLLRVVKSLAALWEHEAEENAADEEEENASDRKSNEDEPEGEDKDTAGSKTTKPSENSMEVSRQRGTSTERRFRPSMLNGLQGLWSALDRLLKLASEEDGAKSKKQGSEATNTAPLSAGVLNVDRMRSPNRSLSPFLARISPMIEAFLVTHSVEQTHGQAGSSALDTPRSPLRSGDVSSPRPASSRSSLIDVDNDGFVIGTDGQLAVFVERHRGPINAILRANPPLLESSFKGALRHPHAIDFDNKKAFFRNVLRRRSSEAHAGTIRINVRRDRVFDDSYHQLRMRTSDEMKGRLHVQFTGEEGVDAGGVTREWYIILARQIFDPNYVLFTRSAAKAATYQPDKRSYINREHLENFKFVGRIIGKAIYDAQLLDAYFTRSFYKHILGMKPTYHDIEAQDPEYYKSLKWMLENDITGILDYTMSAEYDEFGKQTIVDLMPNGRNIPVTEENKSEYVRLVTEVRMTKTIEKQIEAFKEGFYQLIPHDDCKIFNELELELLMSGLPDIDMADLKANVEYTGYTASSPQVNWFWRCVGKMDQEDLARLVMFVTGTSKVPLEGFSMLQGMNGTQKFQIHRVAGNTLRLPSAHTCFNQLDLPEYSSAEILSERLLRAVRECSVGFGFA